ncbi:Mog1p/PsbP-like protein [Gonapodya prolifera JEL478]|uniref:Mog1p/PsbP-like protein n=1 Tax=Gonapodya prolifera (strain JEL478) TaxID=1344416 RepID=A0A139AP97_GONPJ|nr:Mog1p/PsbP-like protein [Gonapodya prolifera JEL478]|eukprot:KXS18577.1 Mog1p/PsbP-like protein [Gonapodya prolifera JEL478]
MPIHELFGGAITAIIPHEFVDASQLRQIPDTQEVFVHTRTDASIIVEILEVAEVGSGQCGSWHFWNIAEENGAKDQSQILAVQNWNTPSNNHLPANSFISVVRGQSLIAKYHEQAKNLVSVLVAVIRLPAPHSADIIITYNDPRIISAESSSAISVEGAVIGTGNFPTSNGSSSQAEAEFKELLESFSILDLSLFG